MSSVVGSWQAMEIIWILGALAVVLSPLGLLWWLWAEARAQRRVNEEQSREISSLQREIHAVRTAFHNRVSALEEGLSAPPASPAPAQSEKPSAELSPQPPTEPLEVDASPPSAETPAPPVPPVPDLPPPAPAIPEPASEAPWERIDWERWIGVRGAALLGGIVLALAALLFLQYSIEKGLIPPIVRVALGLLTGVGAVGGSELLRKRGYRTQANALAGAGAVILYASLWAARNLYDLIGVGLTLFSMILVTVTCGMLSWRHNAREIAVLGLVGGFASPILLSSDSNNPIGLFGYVLMLDMGLLWLARERGWPLLTGLGFLATLLYQAAWILGDMGPDRYWLGLLILAVFAGFFALAAQFRTPGQEPDERAGRESRWSQIIALLAPFAFALYFAANADLGPHLYPTAVLLAVLCAAAGWLGRAQRFPELPSGAAAGALAVVMVWLAATHFTTALAWEACGILVVLAVIFHGFVELELRQASESSSIAARPALITAAGFLFVAAWMPSWTDAGSVWPWIVSWAALGALLVRQSALPGAGRRQIVAAVGVALGFGLSINVRAGNLGGLSDELFLGLAVAACVAFQLLSMRRLEANRGQQALIAAAAAPGILLLAMFFPSLNLQASWWLPTIAALVFGFLTVQAATRLGAGRIYFAAMAGTALCHLVWSLDNSYRAEQTGVLWPALGLQLAAVVFFTFWPFLAGRRLLKEPWTIYAAALAPAAWFLSLRELYDGTFGAGTEGVPPLVLAALTLAAVQLVRSRSREELGLEASDKLRPLVWFSAVALSFVAVAIPLQLDREWITIGWALQGLAMLALWQRLDHPGLKYFGLALLAAVTLRLVANPAVLRYNERGASPVFNWLLYAYLVPAGALLGGAYLLEKLEVSRLREWEATVSKGRNPLGAIACGLAAVAVVFVWINLTIFDAFSTGSTIQVSFERMAARDLTLSLAWLLYALLLLGIGLKRDSGGLRWVSLGFLLLTIGKVFLHDLGELDDLYRVASLVGLALSLILVSLTYQRFVFRKESAEDPE